MVLIFGGAYQGKLDYALERYGMGEANIFYCSFEDTDMPPPKHVIYALEKWIYSLVHAGRDCEAAVKNALPEWKNSIIICDDISGGVVPTDQLCRKWRDATGRAMSIIGANSGEVIRVFCGIGTRIK